MMTYAILKDYIARWRHSRGYGVHSPLAFRIVKECVRPDSKYGFYSDSYLDFEYHEDRQKLKNARMTIRLVNLIRPHRIWYPNGDKRLLTALKMSFPSIHIFSQKEHPKNIDFIIASREQDCKKQWEKMDSIEECCMVIFSRKDDTKALKLEKMPTLTLIGNNFTIMLRKIGMDNIKYRLL